MTALGSALFYRLARGARRISKSQAQDAVKFLAEARRLRRLEAARKAKRSRAVRFKESSFDRDEHRSRKTVRA